MKRLCILIILIAFIGILPALLQYGCFMVAKDFSTQQVPFIVETKRMLASGIPFWSWNSYIGADFIGSYSFYTLTSPFVWFVCLFPYKYILQGITIALILKLVAAGSLTYLYLRKISISRDVSIIGGLLYTFSSFAISNIGYYHFMEPMIVFPLFVYVIEAFLRQEKYGELYLGLGASSVAFINYYFMPATLLCGFLYALCRVLSSDIHISVKRFSLALILVILGVLMSSFIILPTLSLMEGNPRIETNGDFWLPNTLERISTLFLPKMLEQATPMLLGSGWNSNAASLPVIGVFLALLYVLKNNNWVRWLVIISVVFYITPLNGIFSLYTNPTYSRWAYGLSFFFIIASAYFLDSQKRISGKQLFLYVLLALGVVALYYGYSNLGRILYHKWDLQKVDIFDNAIIVLMFIVSLVLLYFYYKSQTTRTLLICVSLFSCLYMSVRVWMVTDSYQSLTAAETGQNVNKSGYITQYVIDNKLPRDKEDFTYRTDFVTRDLNIYQNVGMLKNRASVETYNSANYHTSRHFLSIADTVNNSGYFYPNKYVEPFDALLSVKEIVVYDDSESKMHMNVSRYPQIERGDGYTIYESPYYIPMGFTYDSYIEESIIDSLISSSADINVPMQLLANLVVKIEDLSEIGSYIYKGEICRSNNLDSLVNQRRAILSTDFKGTTSGFTAKVILPRDNVVFYSVPASKGFTAYVDGNKTRIFEVNRGLSAIIVEAGFHKIEFKYMPPGLIKGLIISACAFIILIFFSFIKNRRKSFYKIM